MFLVPHTRGHMSMWLHMYLTFRSLFIFIGRSSFFVDPEFLLGMAGPGEVDSGPREGGSVVVRRGPTPTEKH